MRNRSPLAIVAGLALAAALAAPAQAGTDHPNKSGPDSTASTTLAAPPCGIIECETTPPPSTDPAAHTPAAEGSAAAAIDTVEIVTTDDAGNIVSVVNQDLSGKDGDAELLAPTGDSGKSTPSGCKTATVRNKTNSTLGSLLYTFKTWTKWCWVRSTDNISSASTGWDWIPDDSCWAWQGMNKPVDQHYYDWASGYAPKSGYYHMRQGYVKFTCTVLGLPSLNKYPRNTIRSHSNGTYTWSSSDG